MSIVLNIKYCIYKTLLYYLLTLHIIEIPLSEQGLTRGVPAGYKELETSYKHINNKLTSK